MSQSYPYQRSWSELAADSKTAVSHTLDYMISERIVGTQASANFHTLFAHIMGIRTFVQRSVEYLDSDMRNRLTTGMVRLYSNQTPSTLIDAGCGPGVSSEVVRRVLKPKNLFLVDSMPEALEFARSRFEERAFDDDCHVEYKGGSITDLISVPGIEPASVDQIFMR